MDFKIHIWKEAKLLRNILISVLTDWKRNIKYSYNFEKLFSFFLQVTIFRN